MVNQRAVEYNAPQAIPGNSTTPILLLSINLVPCPRTAADCGICGNQLPADGRTKIASLPCNHLFHKACAASMQGECPVCREPNVESQGPSPSGTMYTSVMSSPCPGFPECDSTIKIRYAIKGGIQCSYHPNPGQSYPGESRLAYLPNNQQGRDLLDRLVYAWKRGLTFSVGTSQTRRLSNVVIWGPLPHKSSLGNGPFGWPDKGYFDLCNRELDKLWVPEAKKCRRRGVPRGPLSPTPSSRTALTRETINYNAPASIEDAVNSGLVHTEPSPSSTELCSICYDPLTFGSSVMVRNCGHFFHRVCILQHNSICPLCRGLFNRPQGLSPSGTMLIEETSDICPGFGHARAIKIEYTIPRGNQKDYHDDPGKPYDETFRIAYLPNTEEGLKLLERLKHAWEHGLTFTIGTSLTTGKSGVVTWATIPHKTSLNQGYFGFPDPNYIDHCNRSLDELHVPHASVS